MRPGGSRRRHLHCIAVTVNLHPCGTCTMSITSIRSWFNMHCIPMLEACPLPRATQSTHRAAPSARPDPQPNIKIHARTHIRRTRSVATPSRPRRAPDRLLRVSSCFLASASPRWLDGAMERRRPSIRAPNAQRPLARRVLQDLRSLAPLVAGCARDASMNRFRINAGCQCVPDARGQRRGS